MTSERETNSPDNEIISVPNLIKRALSKIRGQEGADIELLNILEEHVLKESVAVDAVWSATKAIERLAEERASGDDGTEQKEDEKKIGG